MPASVTSPADVINNSLVRIGYKLRVANLYDGSEAASAALDIYAQTRDEVMRDGDWNFCERNINPTLLKSAPANGYFPPTQWDPTTYPPPPWQFSFTYPTDCLKVRTLKAQPMFPLQMTPLPVLWAIVNDNGYTPTRRVIVCNIQNPVLVYAGQVTDPSAWPPDFVESLSAALGRRLVPRLVGLNAVQLAAQDETAQHAIAAQQQG